MDDAFRQNATCHIHNIGVANMADLSWVKAAEVQRVLAGLASCSVRDETSAFCMRLWPAKLSPQITRYPERLLPADDALVPMLPRSRKLLGVSITGQSLMRRALEKNRGRIERHLTAFRDYAIVPVISTVSASDPEEDDVAGFQFFRDRFLDGFDVHDAPFLDKTWWRENVTPLRLKGIIGALDLIMTQRKHNLIHAIGTQTKAIGIFPSTDDSIARIFYTLRDSLPFESTMLSLNADGV
jgi:hypothetical protein